MATNLVQIIISHDETSANDQRDLYAETGNRELAATKLVDFMKKVVSGAYPASVRTMIGTAKASGTITLASFVEDDTVTVGPITFTGKDTPTLATHFETGGTDATAAASLASAINAHTALDGIVVATSDGAVVTVTAKEPGEEGNAIALAISAHGSVSAAFLAGGTEGDTDTTHYFGSMS
jgi:phage tail sheath gpL-like